MGIKTYNPYTPSRRHMTGYDFSEITKSTPEKSLTVSLKKNSGRNNQGKITVRHHGGGSRRKYRIIDFKRFKDDVPAVVKAIEYDPNRTANIALIFYADGQKAYILAPQGMEIGWTVMNGPNAEVRPGNCLPLQNIPVGTIVHCVEQAFFGRKIFFEVAHLQQRFTHARTSPLPAPGSILPSGFRSDARLRAFQFCSARCSAGSVDGMGSRREYPLDRAAGRRSLSAGRTPWVLAI